MGQFALDISKFCEKAKVNAELVVKKIALDLHGLIIQRSPVDTGRFKANNQIALDTLPTDSIIAVDKDGQATLSAGQAVLVSFKLGETIFLYNNVAYAGKLEFGSSQQAPSGVYRISVEEVISHVESIINQAANS